MSLRAYRAALPAGLALGAALALPAPFVAGADPLDAYPLVSASRVVSAEEAGLEDSAVIVGVVVAGEARAYPIRSLWREGMHTVNDRLGGDPVAVSMCPLAAVGAAYDRRLGDDVVELGTLVEVDRGSLTLYDDASRSRWNLLTGRADDGPRAGQQLRGVSSLFTTWGRWHALYPQTTVYLDPEGLGEDFLLDGERLRLMIVTGQGPARPRDWVIGLRGEQGTAAVLGRELASPRIANLVFEGRPLVAFMTEDRTTSVVWERIVDDRLLTFRVEGDRMLDVETGSSWQPLTGVAETGPLSGRQLTAFPYVTGFWHAWQAHFPDSVVLSVSGE